MIDTTLLRNVRTVVVHDSCSDGTASALIIRDALMPFGAEFVFAQHGTEKFLNLPATKGMLFCDIAPPEHRFAEFLEQGAIVLDHHKTVKPFVERFVDAGLGAFADEVEEPGVSGALLAYRHVWKPMREGASDRLVSNMRSGHVHAFAANIGVRDTWQKNDPRWRHACATSEAIRFYPFHHWPNELFADDTMRRMLDIGEILLERRDRAVKKMIEQGLRAESARGTRMLIIPTRETSDVAETMGDEVDIVIGFSFMHDANREKMIVSTRSRGTFDCRLFCQANGGGGHTRAAGCEVKLDEVVDGSPSPFNLVRAMLDVFEKSGQGIANSE